MAVCSFLSIRGESPDSVAAGTSQSSLREINLFRLVAAVDRYVGFRTLHRPVCTENLTPHIMVMKAVKDRA